MSVCLCLSVCLSVFRFLPTQSMSISLHASLSAGTGGNSSRKGGGRGMWASLGSGSMFPQGIFEILVFEIAKNVQKTLDFEK